jgi:hypothetical protein
MIGRAARRAGSTRQKPRAMAQRGQPMTLGIIARLIDEGR